MKRSSVTFFGVSAFFLTLAFFFSLADEPAPSEPVSKELVAAQPAVQEPVATRPERLRYAVWFSDCGAIFGVLLADSESPPLWIFAKQPLSFSEQLFIRVAIAEGREMYVDTGKSECLGT